MTDLEMTKLCAEAVGWRKRWYWKYWMRMGYDPLHGPACYDQKRELAEMFRLSCFTEEIEGRRKYVVIHWKSPGKPFVKVVGDNNRAIVECVAQMQAAK